MYDIIITIDKPDEVKISDTEEVILKNTVYKRVYMTLD